MKNNYILNEYKEIDGIINGLNSKDEIDDFFINKLGLYEEEEMEGSFKTIFEVLNVKKNNYKEFISYYNISVEELEEIIKYVKFIIISKLIINIEGYTNIFKMLVDKDIYKDDFNVEGHTLFELFKWKNIRDKEKENRKYKNKDYILEENRYKYLCRNIKKRFDFLDIKDNKNFNGKQIYINSIKELDAIEYIWEKNKSKDMSKEEKKKINSARKAYKHLESLHIDKIKNIDFNNLHQFFMEMIKNCEYKFKNIYYYKLEKKMGYYLIKNTIKNINKMDNYEFKKTYILLTMSYLWEFPMLTLRGNLSDELFNGINEGDKKGLEILYQKIEGMNTIFNNIYSETVKLIEKSLQCIGILYKYKKVNINDINFRIGLNKDEQSALYYFENTDKIKIKDSTKEEMQEFKSIFNFENNESEFSNMFVIKRDYNKDDFEIFFKVINELNETIDKINKEIEL